MDRERQADEMISARVSHTHGSPSGGELTLRKSPSFNFDIGAPPLLSPRLGKSLWPGRVLQREVALGGGVVDG